MPEKTLLGFAFVAALLLLVPAPALAQDPPPQPGGTNFGAPAQPPPPGVGPNPFSGPRFPDRRGLTLGFGGGIGSMETSDIAGLGDDSVSGGFFAQAGWMLTPQLAIVGEVFSAFQNTGNNFGAGDVFFSQTGLFAALQFWATPQVWVKGGLGAGFAGFSDDDGIVDDVGSGDGGPGLLLALGYEAVHAPRFSLDLQFQFASATYDGIVDQRVSQGIFAIGLNWFLSPVIGVVAY